MVDDPKILDFWYEELEIDFASVRWKFDTSQSCASDRKCVRLPVCPDKCVGTVEGDEFRRHRLNLETIQTARDRRAENRIMVVIGMKMLMPFRS